MLLSFVTDNDQVKTTEDVKTQNGFSAGQVGRSFVKLPVASRQGVS